MKKLIVTILGVIAIVTTSDKEFVVVYDENGIRYELPYSENCEYRSFVEEEIIECDYDMKNCKSCVECNMK